MSPTGTEFAITAATVFDGERLLQNHCVIVRDDTITQLLPIADWPADLDRVALTAGTLAPGFIDLQVNGGGGLMFNNQPDAAALQTISAAHRRLGTTTIVPTLISDTPTTQQAAVEAVRSARKQGNASIAGIHLEGPFFAATRHGAHQPAMIRQPTAQDLDWLLTLTDLNVIVTLAPEQTAPGQIRQLSEAGIHVCAGHSEASYAQLQSAMAEGLQGFTHLFNAMSPLTAREPGMVGAALDADALWLGIIADGHHVHPGSIRIAHRAKPEGRMLLVSDAMATVGSSTQSFELYDETITRRDDKLVNAAGVLAGSAIAMIDAVRFCHTVVGLALPECLRMASLYPATVLGLDDNIGRIAAGYRADLVHFDEGFVVHNSWLAGEHCPGFTAANA